MGLSYHDTEPAPLPGRAALQFARTVRAPLAMVPPTVRPWLHTSPEVHDSGSAPLGDEAATPQACLGRCERQGRGDCAERCGFVPTESPGEVADSNLIGLGIAELAEQQMRPALRAATWAVAGAGAALVAGVVWFLWLAGT